MYLRCTVYDSPRQWHSWLSLAELWYNSSFHSSLNCSPFKALYSYEPRIGALSQLPDQVSPAVADFATERQCHLDALKAHLCAAQNRMKTQADKHRLDRQFSVGDQVLLKLQPYAQMTVVNRPFPKLAFKFFWSLQSCGAHWTYCVSLGITRGQFGASGVPHLTAQAVYS